MRLAELYRSSRCYDVHVWRRSRKDERGRGSVTSSISWDRGSWMPRPRESYWDAGMGMILIVLSIVAVAIYLAAIQQDLFRRQIPNALSIGLLVVALLKWLVLRDFSAALWAAAIASMVFAVTFLMFVRGWMGGGDVKLMTTSSFLLGAWATYPFLVFTALAGGIVTLIVLSRNVAVRWLPPAPAGASDTGAQVANATVPYGVAIAVGAIWVMVEQLLLNQQTLLR